MHMRRCECLKQLRKHAASYLNAFLDMRMRGSVISDHVKGKTSSNGCLRGRRLAGDGDVDVVISISIFLGRASYCMHRESLNLN